MNAITIKEYFVTANRNLTLSLVLIIIITMAVVWFFGDRFRREISYFWIDIDDFGNCVLSNTAISLSTHAETISLTDGA